jgi:alkyl sulfatase BDS1-like metallo-beta-lactamase superfamily hydrolase
VVQRFLGYWDGNPTNLIPLPEGEVATLFVEMMGGREKIMARGRELHDQGKYLLAQEIVNTLVHAEPQNQPAKELLADIFEQIGYQQENPGLRNSFLAAAYELRSGIPQGEAASSSSPDVIRAMTTELFLNFLGIRMDSRKAEGMRFTMNLVTPDNGEKFIVELENATLTNIQGFQAEKPDLTLTINRADLEQTMMGAMTLDAQIADGTAKVQGDAGILKQLASLMVDFDQRFEIMPGTKGRGATLARADAYEAVPARPIAE